MNNDLIITLIFAAVAAFVLLKLRSVLGRRTGHEQPNDGFSEREANTDGNGDNVVSMPERGDSDSLNLDPDTPAAPVLRQIHESDPTFSPQEFVGGAKAAFEMIVTSFAQGDRETLKPLLAPEVYQSFEGAIADREADGGTSETTLMGFRSVDIVDATLTGSEARVTVKFVSEQSNVERDREGTIVEGDPAEVVEASDVWTFARDLQSRDPNWLLEETDAAA